MRSLTICLPFILLLSSAAVPAAGQGFKDLFKQLGKAVENKVDQTITDRMEGPCLQKEASAQVRDADYSQAGTWVVRTQDGRTFQLRNLSMAGVTETGQDIAGLLSMAESAQFTLIDSSRLTKVYRVHLTYASIGGEKTGLKGALLSTLTQTVQNKVNDFKFETGGIAGSALDGGDWCLNVPTSVLSFLSVVPSR